MSVPTVGRVGRALRENGVWLTALLCVVVFAGAVAVADLDALLDALATVEPATLATVVAVVTAGYGLRFLKWSYYLREVGVDVPRRVSLVTFFSGLMLVVTPGKVGEAWKAWFLHDLEGVPVNRTVAVVGAERVTDLLALAALASLGVVLYERSAVVLVGVGVAFLVGLGLLNWRSACHWAFDRGEALPVVGRHAESARALYESAYDLFRPGTLSVAMVLSLLAWGLEGIALWIVLRDFGAAAGPVAAVAAFGFGSVVGALSFLPGGLAAAEASIVGVLVGLGYPRPVAVAVTLVVRAGTLWYGFALGTAVYALHRARTAAVPVEGSES